MPADTDDATFARFRDVAVEVLQVPSDRIVVKASFAELDADSLDLVELVMALEEEFDITINEEELQDVKSIGEAYELLVSKL